MTVAVKVEKVSYAYADGVAALTEVDFTVNSGDLVCIVGPNGGGKSTLMKLLCGFVEPRQGKVEIFGESPTKARRKVGYMPQSTQFDPAFPISVAELVRQGVLTSHLKPGFTAAEKRRAEEVMRELDIQDLAKKRLGELSGGQRQRALLARALVGKPELLLLDEPTAGSDVKVQDDFHRLLHQLRGMMTIMVVSHHLQYVCGCYDYVLCVNRHLRRHELTDEHPDWSAMFGFTMNRIDHAAGCECHGGEEC